MMLKNAAPRWSGGARSARANACVSELSLAAEITALDDADNRAQHSSMPMSRFQCVKCGVEATRIGSTRSYVPSVDPVKWEELCVMAARARASGGPADPMSVDCPYLKTHVVEQEDAARAG
jgi:hypothetical protein